MPTRSSLGMRWLRRPSAVFRDKLIHVLLAGFSGGPCIGPEAEIDGPPVVRDLSSLQQLRHNLVEVQEAQAEGRMRGGLVLTFVVLVTGVVGINQVNVVDAAGQLADELN